jgi:hypothetical protein
MSARTTHAVRFQDLRRSPVEARPIEVWTADFKGQFRTQDEIYCYPLTVVNGVAEVKGRSR